MYSYAGNRPTTAVDPDGLQEFNPYADVYGVNSSQQEEIYQAGFNFLTVIAALGALATPEFSDLFVGLAVTKVAHAAKLAKTVVKGKRGGKYTMIGKGACDEMRVADIFAAKGDDVLLASDKAFEALPDIRIGGKWWEIRSPKIMPGKKIEDAIYDGVHHALRKAGKQQAKFRNRSRIILDYSQHSGVTFNQINQAVSRKMNGQASLKARLSDIMIIAPGRDPITIPAWRYPIR